MSFIELSTSWSLQILLIGLCAEACAPLLRKAHPGVRARFWLITLLLSLTAPWLLSGVPSATLKPEEGSRRHQQRRSRRAILVVRRLEPARAWSNVGPSGD